MRSKREWCVAAGLAWLVVAGSSVRSAVVDDGDDWQLAYAVFNVAVLAGAALVVTVAGRASRREARSRVRTAGLVVSVGGVAASVMAWAFPLWMTVLGAGLATLSFAAGPGVRRAVALLATAHVAGLLVAIVADAAEVGRRDEWGDHPVASALGVLVTAVVTIVALVELDRALDRSLEPVA